MSKKPPRARAARRQADRAVAAATKTRDRIARLEPGGSAAWPITVPSAVVIEARAAALPCARCGGPLVVTAHDAQAAGDVRRRVVHARCNRCSAPRTVWFEVVAPVDN
ncbi:MAG: hypothetical protein R3B06_00850 [Kofleriaceae bacterium]